MLLDDADGYEEEVEEVEEVELRPRLREGSQETELTPSASGS